MPIYEYKCAGCGKVAEFLEVSNCRDKHECPDCGGTDMEKMLSVFAPMAKQRGTGGKCDSCPEHKCPYSS